MTTSRPPVQTSPPPSMQGNGASPQPGPLFARQRLLFDVFASLNLATFLIFTMLLLWPRFVAFRGRACVQEFLVFLALALVLMAGSWLAFRRTPPAPQLLASFQLAILGAVAGAGVPYHGGRFYEAALWGVTFDKPVHFLWSFAGGLLVAGLLRRYTTGPAGLQKAVVVLATMGLGAGWELVEYIVVMHAPAAGVGLYDNNMQDLAANALGALASLAAPRSWCRLGWPRKSHGLGQ